MKAMRLAVIEIGKGGKHKHRVAICVCECGGLRRVRVDRLARNEIIECAECSIRRAREDGKFNRQKMSITESMLGCSYSAYRHNSKRKQRTFELSLEVFRALCTSSCRFCGQQPGSGSFIGVDRLDSQLGYTPDNSVACCKRCNMAKGTMSESGFIEMATQIANHRSNNERLGLLQRQ